MVAYLEKSEGSEGFHQIINFLSASHIKYALTKNLTIYASLIEQVWKTAALSTIEDEVMAITATIDRNVKVLITEAFIRRHLKLSDSEGLSTLPTEEIFQQLLLWGIQRKVYSSALTKLILRVKKLEQTVKTSKARRKARIFILEDEDAEDPSKQRRSLIEELDMDVVIYLVLPHAAVQGRKLDDTQVNGQPEYQLGVYSAAKARDKARKLHKEELARFNAEQKAIDIARKEKVVAEGDQAHDIDWSDPAVIRYHTLQNRPRSVAEVRKSMCIYLKNQGGFKLSHFKGMSYEDITPIFEKVWDQIHSFVPMNYELEVQRSKRTVQEVERQSTEEEKGKKSDDSSKPTRKKTLARKRAGGNDSQESVKKQNLEDDTEKKELKAYSDIVSEDEFVMKVESLATKYPIIDWKTHVQTEHFMYYQIIREDRSSKNYKIFSEMLDDFDRQDVMDLYRLIEERYITTSPEGYDLMLWGDLKTLFEPDEKNEL
uniref:Uncharacterized protein n=1 Tax=Tanacetum cinerariifolium TaxID=118510 RepID=A0A6L2JVU0_TANCI|nr:hypothetical protein [Tanacetum cinerariifolium]